MRQLLYFFSFVFIIGLTPASVKAQSNPQIHVNSDVDMDKEISDLMNELQLDNDQKLIIGMLILKYSLEFDFKEFEDASKAKKYTMAKAKIKELDNDLKGVLSKDQFKVYKKHKRSLKKELKKSV